MRALNNKQKQGLWLGIAMAVAMGVYPPWAGAPVAGAPGAPGAYAPIYMPPAGPPGQPMQIDYSRLLLQWAMVGMIVYGMILSGEEPSAAVKESKTEAAGSAANPPLKVIAARPSELRETTELRRLRFPDSESLGQVLVESPDDPDYWDAVGEAQGLVGVSANQRVQLELRKDSSVYLGSLGQPEMSAIVSLDASDSKLSDDDLMWVAALQELRDLDLSNTKVTDNGLSHLSRMRSLEKIWLDGTVVTDAGLAVLKELPNLKKVSLAETKVSDSFVISLRDNAKECQFVLSNGKNA